MKPFLFCDVDGVIGVREKERIWIGPDGISMFDPAWHDPANHLMQDIVPLPDHVGYKVDRTHWMENDGYEFRWSEAVTEFLKSLIVSDQVEFIWLSNWREHAVRILNPLFGFPEEVTYLDWEKHPQDYKHALKADALKDFLSLPENCNRPFIWVDDLATEPYLENSEAVFASNPHLIIQTTVHGLNKEHSKRISDFVASHRSAETLDTGDRRR